VVVWRCRTLYNVALEQRKTAWERCHSSVKRSAQEAELKDIREAFPEYRGVHSHVLQDVLARLDNAYQAFFERIKRGETPGYPRFGGTPSLPQLHLQRLWQRSEAGEWHVGALHDWVHQRPLVSPHQRGDCPWHY
jgi:transposase